MATQALRVLDSMPLFPGCKILDKLDPAAKAVFERALEGRKALPPRCELVKDGEKLANPQLVLDGWAARVSYLADGRRQILAFVLPGEFIGTPLGDSWIATSSIVSITRTHVCAAPAGGTLPSIDRLYAASRQAEERSFLAQIVRLSQMTAYERIANLLLDIWHRLSASGCVNGGRFHCPLTQDMLADAVGLTPVHVNRTLQALRKDELITWRGREVTIDPERLRSMLSR
jgi:CRP-like cAMP-binding protein